MRISPPSPLGYPIAIQTSFFPFSNAFPWQIRTTRRKTISCFRSFGFRDKKNEERRTRQNLIHSSLFFFNFGIKYSFIPVLTIPANPNQMLVMRISSHQYSHATLRHRHKTILFCELAYPAQFACLNC
jgi:hypothetical protein